MTPAAFFTKVAAPFPNEVIMMNELWNACREDVLSDVVSDADRAQRETGLSMAEPFFHLLTGWRFLAAQDDLSPTVRLPALARLIHLPEDQPIPVVAHPWSRQTDLPPDVSDYRYLFSTVFVTESLAAIETFGEAAYGQTQRYFMEQLGGVAFLNVLNYDDQSVYESFEAEVVAAMARGLTSAGTLSLLYARHGHQAGYVRLGATVRYLAQVVPVGFLHDDPALHVLCRG